MLRTMIGRNLHGEIKRGLLVSDEDSIMNHNTKTKLNVIIDREVFEDFYSKKGGPLIRNLMIDLSISDFKKAYSLKIKDIVESAFAKISKKKHLSKRNISSKRINNFY